MIYPVTQYDLLTLPVKKGQIYFVTDCNCLFKDYGTTKSERSRFNATVVSSHYIRLNKLRPVCGRYYYVSEDNSLWVYDTRWILEDGDTRSYNAFSYTSNNAMTPVINTDDHITGVNGDKIIDNNGLIGDGSVVIRDKDRVIRGKISKDVTKQQLTFTNYLDNGIGIYPYGMGSTETERTETGSLILGVNTLEDSDSVNSRIIRKGVANYFGDLYVHGNIYTVSEKDATTYDLSYSPQLNEVMLHRFSTSVTHMINDSREIVYSEVEIQVVNDSLAYVRIKRYKDGLSDAVIGEDGKALYNSAITLLSDESYEAKRVITSSSIVSYTLTGPSNPTEFIITGSPFSAAVTIRGGDMSYSDESDISARTTVTQSIKCGLGSISNQIPSIIGTWATQPVISGVTCNFSIQLNFPINIDCYRIVVDGKFVSNGIPVNESYTTAPVLFDGDKTQIALYNNGSLILTTRCNKSYDINNVKTGVLFVEN